MKRKAIQLAGKTLVVSLPAKWAREHNIKKGEELELLEDENRMIISTSKDAAKGKVTIDLRKLGTFNKDFVSHVYQKGYDEVKFILDKPSTLSEIEERVSNLLGFEIIDQQRESCTIKSISSEMESEFDTILRKIFLMLNSMSEQLLNSVKKGDYTNLKEIKLIEKSNNKFTDFCLRVLNKRGYKDSLQKMYLHSLIRELEKIADSYKRICENLEKENKIEKELVSYFEEVHDYLINYYELFYKFDQERSQKLNVKIKKLIKDGESLLENPKIKNKLVAMNLICIARMIYELKGPYYKILF